MGIRVGVCMCGCMSVHIGVQIHSSGDLKGCAWVSASVHSGGYKCHPVHLWVCVLCQVHTCLYIRGHMCIHV